MPKLRLLPAILFASSLPSSCAELSEPDVLDEEAPAPLSPASAALQSRPPKPRTKYPAIVVGSGYGGSVAAFHLGSAGIETLVLERGREWPVNDPTTNATFATLDTVTAPGGDGRSTWMNDHCIGNSYLTIAGVSIPCPVTTGILEETVSTLDGPHDATPRLLVNGVRARVGVGVGGGSLVNNGVAFAPTKTGWDAAFPPAEQPVMQRVWQDLDATYFAVARSRLMPAATPDSILNTAPYSGNRLFATLAQAAGYPKEDPANPATLEFGYSFAPVTVDWSKVADEISGARVPAFILGETFWGNNSGAKLSVDKPSGYLGRARATGHVTVKPLHTVMSVTFNKRAKLYTLTVRRTDLNYVTQEDLTFTTRHLFMAAGSLGTTKLLVKARDTGALPDLNPEVGTRWNTNGDMAHFRFVSDQFVPQGGPGGVKIMDFREPNNPVVIEQPPLRVPSFFASDPRLSPFLGAVFTIGLGVPTGKGSFSYDPSRDAVVLDWPADGAANVYQRVTSILTAPTFPGQPLVLPIAQSQGLTLHPLGGVPLGMATDEYCELRGYKGLYAVDGSILPGPAAATNPLLTITALAERCMAHITRELAEDCD